jgi:hypothetical protein
MPLDDHMKRWLKWISDKTQTGSADPADEKLWGDFLAQAATINYWFLANFIKLSAARHILSATPEQQVRLLLIGMRKLGEPQRTINDESMRRSAAIKAMVTALLRPDLPLDSDALTGLLRSAVHARSNRIDLPYAGFILTAERYSKRHGGLSDIEHLKLIRQLLSQLGKLRTARARKFTARIDMLLHGKSTSQIIESGEPWADSALKFLEAFPSEKTEAWRSLLEHATTATTSNPTKKWLKSATDLISQIGKDNFISAIPTWFSLVGQPGPGRIILTINGDLLEPTAISPKNADVLKGLAWAASTTDDARIARSLGDLAEVCFKKIPTFGARCAKVANAALAGLALMTGPEPVAQITRVGAKAKKASARKQVERALGKSATNQGVSPDELEEMSVPDFGLDANGVRSIPAGDASAEIHVNSPSDIELHWRSTTGKTQASIPAETKRDHPDAVKEAKRVLKDLERVLPSQAARVERLLLDRRTWPASVWRKRYLDHRLVSHITRRLIWETTGDSRILFLPADGKLVDPLGQPINLPTDASVRLWHPIDSSPQQVLAWRTFLMDRNITQPFKQAHREIYLLTDAERATATYSNRFAAHILRQHQFQALCDARGWTYRLMGNFDSHNIPTRYIPAHDMSVEFWVDAAGGGADISSSGIFLHVATDQVRFSRGHGGAPMPLADVPPIVFSELMRDVDLFVGVASVGNDPAWRDGGPEQRYLDYWESYSFGDLSETAKTRMAVLESLLPRLTKLQGKWSLQGNFLLIRGQLRTYKIHLGSGNILMEPNDQYLCIVPDRSTRVAGTGGNLFLPFEGDSTLSVILSKAFLLAEDTEIKDPTITRQIG